MFHVKHSSVSTAMWISCSNGRERSISSPRRRWALLWTRHILDSRANRRDLGRKPQLGGSRLRRRLSGSGHRHLAQERRYAAEVHLIESDQRKARFPGEAVRHNGRAGHRSSASGRSMCFRALSGAYRGRGARPCAAPELLELAEPC